MRINLKYILPFFIVFCFLIAGDYSFSTYNYSDYIRLSEYVQIDSSTQIPTKSYYFTLYKLPIEMNRFSIFQCNDIKGYFDQHIKIKLVFQNILSDNNKPLKWIITKFQNPKDTDKDHFVDIRRADSIMISCLSHRLMYNLISNKWDLILFQQCIKLSKRSFGFFILSSDLQTGSYALST